MNSKPISAFLLSAFCFLLFSMSAFAADQTISLTITVTNTAGTTNGETLTITNNGSPRTYTWTNSPQTTLQIGATNTAAKAATNLFRRLSTDYPTSPLVTYASATSVKLQSFIGKTINARISTNWGTLTLVTNPVSGTNTGSIETSNLTTTVLSFTDGTSQTTAGGGGGGGTTYNLNASTNLPFTGLSAAGQTAVSNAAQTVVAQNLSTNSVTTNAVPVVAANVALEFSRWPSNSSWVKVTAGDTSQLYVRNFDSFDLVANPSQFNGIYVPDGAGNYTNHGTGNALQGSQNVLATTLTAWDSDDGDFFGTASGGYLNWATNSQWTLLNSNRLGGLLTYFRSNMVNVAISNAFAFTGTNALTNFTGFGPGWTYTRANSNAYIADVTLSQQSSNFLSLAALSNYCKVFEDTKVTNTIRSYLTRSQGVPTDPLVCADIGAQYFFEFLHFEGWKQSGSNAAFYVRFENTLTNLESSITLQNHLVLLNTNRAGFAFFDSQYHNGNIYGVDVFTSLMRRLYFVNQSIMASAAGGRAAYVAACQAEIALIDSNLASSCFNTNASLYRLCLGRPEFDSPIVSAYAVYSGAATGSVATAISERFVQEYLRSVHPETAAQTFLQRGGIRMLVWPQSVSRPTNPKVTDGTTGHDGAYWPFVGWVATTLAVTRPDLAEAYIQDYKEACERLGQFNEAFNHYAPSPVGGTYTYLQSPAYLTAVASPLTYLQSVSLPGDLPSSSYVGIFTGNGAGLTNITILTNASFFNVTSGGLYNSVLRSGTGDGWNLHSIGNMSGCSFTVGDSDAVTNSLLGGWDWSLDRIECTLVANPDTGKSVSMQLGTNDIITTFGDFNFQEAQSFPGGIKTAEGDVFYPHTSGGNLIWTTSP